MNKKTVRMVDHDGRVIFEYPVTGDNNRQNFKAAVEEAIGQGIDLTRWKITYSNLKEIDFSRAQMRRVTFTSVTFAKAKFDESDLGETKFIRCDLSNASFKNACIHNTSFLGSRLSGTDFTGSYVFGQLSERLDLVGTCPITYIHPIGSRASIVEAFNTNKGLYIKTGTFYGHIDELCRRIRECPDIYNHEFGAAMVFLKAKYDSK